MFSADNIENYIVNFQLEKEKTRLLQKLSEIETLLKNETSSD